MKKNRQVIFYTITIFIGALIPVLVLEIVLRILGLGYGRSGHISDAYLHHVNPSSFEYVAHSPAGEFEKCVVKYNSYGFRQNNMETVAQKKKIIALLGDSYTLSRELAYDSTFAGRLESRLADSCGIINFGVASYSPLLYLVQWKRVISQYRPSHVVVQLYVNDTDDDRDYLRHAKYSEDKKTVVSVSGPSSSEMVIKQLVMKSYFLRFVFKTWLQIKWLVLHADEFGNKVGGFIEPNPEIPEISKTSLLQLASAVQASGAQFIITVIPSKCRMQGENCDTSKAEFSDRWRDWSYENGIKFLDLVPSFREAAKQEKLFFDRDIHLNSFGSSIVSREVMKVWPELFITK